MQKKSSNLINILQHAANIFPDVEIVTRKVEDNTIHRYSYLDAYTRTKKLANALKKLGVKKEDPVGTLGWNTYRHLESWYAIAGQGAICHTINPRLFSEQIEFIINHAKDHFLIIDVNLVAIIEEISDKIPSVKGIIILTDKEHMPECKLKQDIYCYEDLIAQESDNFQWPDLPEDTISSLCYTSGTTGNPKGVAYTHGSNYQHAAAASRSDFLNITESQSILMVVPMFHANSWGITYAAPLAGSKLVLPGCALDGSSVFELLENEKVTLSAAVPTVWNLLLAHLSKNALKLPWLQEVIIGGSAVPRSMIETFDRDYGVNVIHAWGMTETSPLGSVCRLTPAMNEWDYDRKLDLLMKQGRPPFGLEMKIVDAAGVTLPHDGNTFGHLLVRGSWVVESYYLEEKKVTDDNDWFDTGDIATIDCNGYMNITDRAKDVIKSGGEWISSIDLENAAIAHPSVKVAAVVGVPHPKWEERPLLVLELNEDCLLEQSEILAFLTGKVIKWWIPEEVKIVKAIPMTATGKINKLELRKIILK